MQRRNRGVAVALAGAAGTWLCACSARADVVAGWNFNTLTGAVPAFLQADSGGGVVSFGEFTGGLGALAGTDVNAMAGEVAGQSLSITGSGQNGHALVLEVDTAGRTQLSLSVAARRSASGFSVAAVEAWNGTGWQRVGAFDASTTQWQQHQFSLAECTFLENGSARIRLKVENATSGSGNIRFDNLRIEAVPGPAGAAALGAAGAAAARRGARTEGKQDEAAGTGSAPTKSGPGAKGKPGQAPAPDEATPERSEVQPPAASPESPTPARRSARRSSRRSG